MLYGPDIGDEMSLSFELQASVYLASALLVEKQRGTWSEIQIWSILLQGSELFRSGSFESFLKQSCSNPPQSSLQIIFPMGCENKVAVRKISSSNDLMFLGNKLHTFVSKAAKKQHTLPKGGGGSTVKTSAAILLSTISESFSVLLFDETTWGPIWKRSGEIKGFLSFKWGKDRNSSQLLWLCSALLTVCGLWLIHTPELILH